MKRALLVLTLITCLAVPAALLAHEGHAHHVMGTVNATDASLIEVKDTGGKLRVPRPPRSAAPVQAGREAAGAGRC